MKARIVFVARGLATDWPDIAKLDEPGLDREFERFRRGVDNWIVQGYVRLRAPLEAMGHEVRISDRFERGAICVAHRDDINRYGDPLHDCYVVGVRADRPPGLVAQLEVVQSPVQLTTPRSRFIAHWPQPALLPRDPARGTRIERAVYYGRVNSVPAWYGDAAFRKELAALGIAFEARDSGWNDYRDVDVVLAHRDETPAMLENKPASKLVNAWLAGVPAIVAPEPAFMALHGSELDFIATRDAEQTRAAFVSLARDPARYAAMVANGLARGREFTVEALRERWLALFRDEVLPGYERWKGHGNPLSRRAAFWLALSRQKIVAKRFRARERREKRALP